LKNIYDIISNPVYESRVKSKVVFENAMHTEVSNQILLSPQYAKFLAANSWEPGDPIDSLPYLPVGAFKHQSLLTKVEGIERGLQLKSSGTSGVTSSIFIDQETSRRQKLSLRLTMEDYFGDERRPALIFDADPRSGDSLGARQAAIMGYARNASKVDYLLEEKDGLLAPSQKWIDLMKNPPNEKVMVIGFTYVLWRFLSDLAVTCWIIYLCCYSKVK
jgi:hypothetical protein